MKKSLKLVVIVGSLLTYQNALALRCGNDIVHDNESLHEVQQKCQDGETYQVNNENVDIVKYYYKKDGMMNEMTFVDGKLQSIESSR